MAVSCTVSSPAHEQLDCGFDIHIHTSIKHTHTHTSTGICKHEYPNMNTQVLKQAHTGT